MFRSMSAGGGWGGGGGGGGGGFREEDPFAADNARKAEADGLFAADNTGIDFDAYEDIPVEATGEGVPEPIHSFTGERLVGHTVDNRVRVNPQSFPSPLSYVTLSCFA